MAQPTLTDGRKIRFAWGTADSEYCDVTRPIFNYKTIIHLAWNISKQDDNTYEIYDDSYLGIYDTRQCEFELMLSEDEQYLLTSGLAVTDSGRAKEITITTIANSGFFPYGPDKGDTGPWVSAVEMLNTAAIGPAPWKHFRSTIRITFQGTSWPAWTQPADDVSQGPISIGNVDNIRFPELWFQPKNEYGIQTTIMNGYNHSAQYWNSGASGDGYTTSAFFKMRIPKACRVLNYITNTGRSAARNGTLYLYTPAYSYPFGPVPSGSSGGALNVQLIQNRIEVMHVQYNMFTTQLNLNYISAYGGSI